MPTSRSSLRLRTALLAAAIALAMGAQSDARGDAGAPPVPAGAAEIAAQAQHSLLTDVVHVGQDLLAVGTRGHILRSPDGVQWQQVAVPYYGLLTAVFFVDERHGWAVGHDAAILHSGDGGRTWALQHFQPAENQPLLDVLFLDPQRGFAVGAYGMFLETRDGGVTWTAIAANEATEAQLHFNAIVRLGDGALLVVGEEGMLVLSEDEGASWRRLPAPYESSLFAVAAYGHGGAIIGGLRGNLYRSDDVRAGQWTRIDLQSSHSVFGLADLGGGETAVAGLNATLMRVDAQGRAQPIALRPQGGEADAPVNTLELGAFSGVLRDREAVITVGDAGIRRWQLPAAAP